MSLRTALIGYVNAFNASCDVKAFTIDGALVYFSCDDCSVQERLALANGGQVFKTKFSIGPNGFISIIGDSEGNAIGLHSFA